MDDVVLKVCGSAVEVCASLRGLRAVYGGRTTLAEIAKAERMRVILEAEARQFDESSKK